MVQRLAILGLAVLIVAGCKKQEQTKFTPPPDGKVTKELADKYIKAAKALELAIARHQTYIRDFMRRFKIDSLSQLQDTAFIREHPEVMDAWQRLQRRWKEAEQDAYRRAGLTEDAFNWIGMALTDTINADIREYVQRALAAE
ncbi:hypothetical protein J7J56_05365 [candidate division WOR-3 bacterium]|nr:hypothetical protein [candidate division WOR-3 bacterium]